MLCQKWEKNLINESLDENNEDNIVEKLKKKTKNVRQNSTPSYCIHPHVQSCSTNRAICNGNAFLMSVLMVMVTMVDEGDGDGDDDDQEGDGKKS